MVYDFKDDVEDKDGEFMVDGLNLKQAIANNWIDPPKRERKRVLNYSESEYYRNTLKRKMVLDYYNESRQWDSTAVLEGLDRLEAAIGAEPWRGLDRLEAAIGAEPWRGLDRLEAAIGAEPWRGLDRLEAAIGAEPWRGLDRLEAAIGAEPWRGLDRLEAAIGAEPWRGLDRLEAASGGKERGSAGPRLPKMPTLSDFQFFNTQRLHELFHIEHQYELHKHALSEKEQRMKAQGASDEPIEKALAPGLDDPQPLSEQEQGEKERLLSEGFTTWTRRDFNSFVRACEKYGRANLAGIASEVDGKPEEEVRAYSAVFWQRYKELSDWEKVYKTIERGEQKIQRQQDIMNAISSKLEKYKNPWQDMKVQYGANKGKAYTEEEDRFILCMTEIRKSWRFRFDWFFKSRTAQELARRCDTLIRLIEKENEDSAAAEGKKAGKRSMVAAGSREGSMGPPGGGVDGRKRKSMPGASPMGGMEEGGSPSTKKAKA
eukprot:gene18353-24818_t